MRTVFCLWELTMFVLIWNTFCPLSGFVWRRLTFLWRCVVRWFPFLLELPSRLRLPWRREGGEEPGSSGEGHPPVRRYSADDEEAGGRGVQVLEPEPRGAWTEVEQEVGEERAEPTEEPRVDPTDEFYCDYDSTWESEPPQDEWRTSRRTSRRTPRSGGVRNEKFRRFESAARDMQNYRHNYPRLNRARTRSEMPNLSFYTGETASLPDGVYIQDFHATWYGDYHSLEYVHTFIQWLFPLQEPGMNSEASTLTEEEIEKFCENDLAKENLLKSYKLMLDFYGIELADERTGELRRADNWRERFHNLNSHTHNNLRITRILKCLGTLGYPHYQAPLVRFFLEETLVNDELPKVKDSVLSYFLFAVLEKSERRDLLRFAYQHYHPRGEFVWCPQKIQEFWSNSKTNVEF